MPPSTPLPGPLLGRRQWRRHTLAVAALLLYGTVIWRARRDLDMMRDLRSQSREGR